MARRNNYLDALQSIMADDSPAVPTTRPRAEIEAMIEAITKELCECVMSDTERLWLVADRRDLRKQLAATPTPDVQGG